MLDGMKMAAQGMMTMSAKQDIITNNLANVGTAGYCKESIAITSFTEILDREVGADGMNQSSYEIHGAPGVTKSSTTAVDTFVSPTRGLLGTVTYGAIEFFGEPRRRATSPPPFPLGDVTSLPRVDIVYAHAGMDGAQGLRSDRRGGGKQRLGNFVVQPALCARARGAGGAVLKCPNTC